MNHNKKSVISFALAAIGLAGMMSLVGFASEDLIHGPQLQLAAQTASPLRAAINSNSINAGLGNAPQHQAGLIRGSGKLLPANRSTSRMALPGWR